MYRGLCWVILIFSSMLSGCITTPPLEEATDSSHSNIMINEVVQRVKCELSYAFDKKAEDPKFSWLASWTAHVDLTLMINDTAGITPNGSYTAIQKSAVNFDAGPSSFPATAARSLVPQMFTLGASATLNSQAVRTETLSFTLALDELKVWRENLDRIENNPSFPVEKRTCAPRGIGVLGNLGLKEWVDSAFYPVEFDALQAGFHPQPQTQKAASAPIAASSPSQGQKLSSALAVQLTCKGIRDKIDNWLREFKWETANIELANAVVTAADKKITTSASSLDTKISTLKMEAPQYKQVSSPMLKKRLELLQSYNDTMWQYVTNSAQCVERLKKITTATANTGAYPVALTAIPILQQLVNNKCDESDATDIALLNGAIPELWRGPDAQSLKPLEDHLGTDEKNAKACAVRVKKDADSANVLAAALPSQIDPPIDSILHSVNFVITYGASISPSWTLIQWKGPALTAPLASATGIRTHTLLLSLGPRTGTTGASQDALRLITNQTVRALGN
jgi:hypothetical protein